MKTRNIFASVILAAGLTISQANAATTTNNDDSPANTKPASAMLVNGTQTQFAVYVGHSLGKFAQTTQWVNFMNVVMLYNQSPAAVLLLSPADRATFNEASAVVLKKLASQKGTEAAQYLNQAHRTTRLINFLWDVNLPQADSIQLTEIQ